MTISDLARQHAEARCDEKAAGLHDKPIRCEEPYLHDVLAALLDGIEGEVAGMRPSPTEFCDFYVARDDVLALLRRWKGEG
jgi:hypothetical protein